MVLQLSCSLLPCASRAVTFLHSKIHSQVPIVAIPCLHNVLNLKSLGGGEEYQHDANHLNIEQRVDTAY